MDDVIVQSGENMSPGEIEDVLLEHDAVFNAAVVGLPDEQWGEAVLCDARARRRWLRGKLEVPKCTQRRMDSFQRAAIRFWRSLH